MTHVATTPTATVPAARAAAGTDASASPEQQTPQQRSDRGKQVRAAVPRSSHGVYRARPDRRDPVEVLEEQSASRVPELVPVRYGRMVESPFRFYRGAAALMAADLAGTPDSGIRAQLCGDAHMLNFRLLASPERHLLFDINDFDETSPGPWEWDVKRLATSLVIAGRANGFSEKDREGIVTATIRSYREWMNRLASMRHLDVWYLQADMKRVEQVMARHLSKPARARLSKSMASARAKDSLQAFDKLTSVAGGRRQIVADPPLVVPLHDLMPGTDRQELERWVVDLIARYGHSLSSDHRHLLEQYRFVDMARKVVGVGSVGTRCWIVLLLGRDDSDPLLIQVKEAGESVLAEHVGAGEYSNQGQRVVAGQRLMQAASDIFLGYERAEGIDGQTRDFYIRQLHDWKGVAVAEEMTREGMRWFGALSGATLARAHARSGDRVAIAGYLGGRDSFDRALTRFAEVYADQNERDHQALVDAVASGRVVASTTT